MKEILIPISPGELLDKITILRIKSERIKDASKLLNIRRELEMLDNIWSQSVTEDPTIKQLTEELTSINESLLDI